MKKLVLLIIMMFSFAVVNAEETVNVRLEWVPNVYYNYEKNGLNYWGQFAYIYAGDKVAYCLDISQNINSEVYTKSDEIQSNNLVVLTGYFGYGYDGNISLKDYMATQKLIWGYLGTDVYFTTKSNGAGEIIDIFDEKVKIVYRINNHATFPSYDTDYKFTIGSSNNILQKNNINNGYNILNNTDNVIQFNYNGILFNANEVGKNSFYLETKYIKNFDNQIYIADNSQKIMIIGGINNLRRKYSYEVIGGTINIKLSYSKIINQANILDNLFEIYNEKNELIGTYSPDINGNILVNNLKLGKYRIKELNISEGYNISEYESNFEITEDSLNQVREICLYPKTTNVTINKTFSNTLIKNLNYDEGIIYKIYDFNDNYINELITNENGTATTKLEYGNYKIVQSNINNIDTYHEDIVIDTTMFDEDLIFNVHDDISKAKIKVLILNKESDEPIGNLNFKINDEEKITNDNGIFITDLLNFGTYKISDITKDGYTEHENINYKLDENIEYYVFENEAYVDLIIYLDKVDEPEISIEKNESSDEINVNIGNDKDNSIDKDKDNSIGNNIDNNKVDNEIDVEKENVDNKSEIIEVNDNSDLKQDIDEDNLNDDTNKQITNIENNNTEKLPFLGEDIKKNEKTKIYNYINYFFNFNWMFFL